jgi:hypothetical protein
VTEDEIRRLYALVMSYDNRRLSEANITAWWEQAMRNRWTFDEAREAIHAHHAESTEFLMPAHITTKIRAARRQPAPVAAVRALAPAQPSQPQRFRSIITTLADRLGWDREPTGSDAALDRECPHCQALPGRPCVRQVARGHRRGELVPIAHPHPSRLTTEENQ